MRKKMNKESTRSENLLYYNKKGEGRATMASQSQA
jgi:hypothetical protein